MLKSISFAAAMMTLIASTVAARAADVTGVQVIKLPPAGAPLPWLGL